MGLGKKREPELVCDSNAGAESRTALVAGSPAGDVMRDSRERGASDAGGARFECAVDKPVFGTEISSNVHKKVNCSPENSKITAYR